MNRLQLAAAVAGALFLLDSAVGCGSAEPTLPTLAAPVAATSAPTSAPAPTTTPTTAPTTAPVTAAVAPVVGPATVAPAPRRVPATTRAAAPKPAASSASGCNSNYTPCVPNDPKDVDCQGGSGNGPSYVKGPVTVTGTDVYGLDADKDGIGCE